METFYSNKAQLAFADIMKKEFHNKKKTLALEKNFWGRMQYFGKRAFTYQKLVEASTEPHRNLTTHYLYKYSDPQHHHMKHTANYLFLLLFLVLISGCSSLDEEGMIWDFTSSTIDFRLHDENGHSLIDPHTKAGNEILRKISITWREQKYHCEGIGKRDYLRAMPEFYHGIRLKKDKNEYLLSFGEFQPNYPEKEYFELDIPGIGKYSIAFINHVKTKGRNATYTRNLWINGNYNSNSTAPFEVTLVIKRETWENAINEKDKNAFMPVTVYIESNASDIPIPTAEESPQTKMKIEYKGKVFSFRGYDSAFKDYSKSSEPVFYGTYEYFDSDFGQNRRNAEPILAFGPFDIETPLKNEKFKLILNHIGEYELVFDSYLSNGQPYYKAVSINGDYVKDISYFRNGPLFILR